MHNTPDTGTPSHAASTRRSFLGRRPADQLRKDILTARDEPSSTAIDRVKVFLGASVSRPIATSTPVERTRPADPESKSNFNFMDYATHRRRQGRWLHT